MKVKHSQLKNILIKLDHIQKILRMISRKQYHTWKNQLTISINFMSSKDNDEERVMHSRSNNIELMINDKWDKVIEELFQSSLSKYQIGLETSMKGSDFIFPCANLLQCKCHRINVKRGGSYIYFPDWIII